MCALFVGLPLLLVAACDDSSSSSGGSFTPPEAGAPFNADASTPPSQTSDASAPDAAPADAAPSDAGAESGVDAGPPKFVTALPFATGLDNARVPLADLAVDPHWTITDAMGNALTAYVQTDALGFVGFWMQPTPTSKFLSPFVDTVDPGVGPFTYKTTFTLATGANLAATVLTVSYASDNSTDAITLNGQNIAGVTSNGYSTFVVLPMSGPFVVGPNTIAFVSSNSGGPTGFRAELTLSGN